MTRSTLVALVVALACSCRPKVEVVREADASPARAVAAQTAQQEAMLAAQQACRALRSQVFTETEVQRIGDASRARWLGQRTTHADARLTRVANTLRTKVPARAWQFLVVDDAKVDSFSVPPATVLVTRGLLTAVKTDGALAGVVAHEVAHVVADDALDVLREQNELRCQMRELLKVTAQASNQQLRGEFAIDANDPAFVIMADSLIEALTTRGYGVKAQATQNGELLADAEAARWIHAAGFDVRDYAEALSTLDGLSVPHPPTSKRVEALETVRQTLPPLPAAKPRK